MQRWFGLLFIGCLLLGGERVVAWDYTGHRVVNLLALDNLPADFPAFAKTAASRERIAFLAGEGDRWRNTRDLPFKHVNDPDHFFDLEDTKLYGVDLDHLTPFRYVFVEQLNRARIERPDKVPPVDKKKNYDRTKQLLGFLPWAIQENYAKLKSGFSYLKAYQEGGGTEEEIRQAQMNIVYVMGVMGHYCGDASQPLHTTKHYNGWVGDNPKEFTTSRRFHSWIDGGFFREIGGIDQAVVKQGMQKAKELNTIRGRTDYMFPEIVKFMRTQHELVGPLYQLEKDGKLTGKSATGKAGSAFMHGQIGKASGFLSDLWYTAYKHAPKDTYLLNVLAKRQLDGK